MSTENDKLENVEAIEMEDEASEGWFASTFPLFSDLLPYMFMTLLASVLACMALMTYWAPAKTLTSTEFVTFDPIKYTAGQKAVAAAFIGQDVNAKAEAAALLRNVTSSTRELIADVAQGRVVLVKQGVVGGVYEDITDQVMESAGLPTENLPTVDLITQIAETEPTKLSASMIGQIKEIERRFLEANSGRAGINSQRPEDVLP